MKFDRDWREAFPAMLAAIDSAQCEILLEMYSVGNDALGVRFRDRLTGTQCMTWRYITLTTITVPTTIQSGAPKHAAPAPLATTN